MIQKFFLYLFTLMLTYKIYKNYIFGKQNGGTYSMFFGALHMMQASTVNGFKICC